MNASFPTTCCPVRTYGKASSNRRTAHHHTTGRGRTAFTLIEMLAVILIISILIAIAFGVFAGVRQQAWRAKSRDLARQIAHAWTQRLLTEREFPAAAITAQGGALGGALGILQSNAEHLDLLNAGQTNGTYFLELKVDERRDGLKDKWGTLFNVRLDTDYDGLVKHPFDSSIELRTSVVVWSDRFGNPSGPQYTTKPDDDIVVW